jgi:hypothetical protein
MDLKEISDDIKNILEKRRKEHYLTFIEEDHKYYMKDVDGAIKSTFPSVSTIIKRFHKKFDANGISLKMAGGNVEKQKQILQEWKDAGDYSTNMGSRVHYELELELIKRYGNYKEVRQPIFNIDKEQEIKSNMMIKAGKSFLDLIHERGGVLLDTEIVLGDPEEKYVGQPDKVWLFQNKQKDGYGFVITDYKTNKPKNFEIQPYTEKMFSPFDDYHDTALAHYYVQLPLYGRLLVKMLKNTKYEDIKLLGGVVVLLKDDGTFVEYKVPQQITNTVFSMELKKYI